MPRPFFPHTMADVLRAVDGPLGLIVGDMPDGSIRVLKRNRKEPGYTLTSYADAQRTRVLGTATILDRVEAVNRFAEAIGLGEALTPGL